MMQTSSAAAVFRWLHARERVLLLPNAWDAASAAFVRAAGAQAVATTSGGVAWACGYPDGDVLPLDHLFAAVREIRRVVVDVPLTVDFESGYSDDPHVVAERVEQLVDLGVAGVNLEDRGGDPELLAAKLRAVRERCAAAGKDVFLNARADLFLLDPDAGAAAVGETIARGRRYAAAGADGFFAPGVSDEGAIRAIAQGVALALNLLALPGLPAERELYALGVRRLSAGVWLPKLAYGAAREAATAFLRDGDSSALTAPYSVDYGETNAMLERS